ncbi:MAG: hypothetical protein FWC10_09240 [Lentimicrobiaceae bacterium]|nr:hypothetical protein [Lentimicrobiaceae bacterium]
MLNFFSKARIKEDKDLLVGHGTFIILLIFSVIFVNERVLFIDSAYQLFEMIQRCGFQQNVRRYSMFLAELLPLLAIKLQLSLKIVVLFYSVSFTLIAYGFWALTTYVLKNRYVGIIMLFTMIGMRHTFFHTISETFQLMFFAAFLYAWLNSRFAKRITVAGKSLYYFVALFMMTLCTFIHPVALFFLVFILGIYILNKNYTISQKTLITLITIGIVILKFATVVQGSHDTDYNMGIREFLGYCLHIYRIRSTEWFFIRLIDFYWAPVLLLVLALIYYRRKKQYLNFWFFLGFNLSFLIITLVLYHNPDSAIGRERSFLPLMFFCGVPFMRDVFPNISLKQHKAFYITLTCLLCIGFVKIAIAAIPYSKRINKIEEIVAFANQENQKKLVMDREASNAIIPFFNWATGFESMMYSAMMDKNSTVNFYIEEDLDTHRTNANFLNEDIFLAVPWWTFWEISYLNPHYFTLPKQPAKELVVKDGKFVIKELNP